MMNRRRFLQFLGLAPAVIPAVVKALAASEAPVLWEVGVAEPAINPIDQLNAATLRHIRRSPKLIDGIFQKDPLLSLARTSWPGGRVIHGNFVVEEDEGAEGFDGLLAYDARAS